MGKLKWICTDPDSNQYGRKVPGAEGVFEFRQKSDGGEIKEKVDLGEYKLNTVEGIINSYGYTMYKNNKNKKAQYIFDITEDVDFLIAECIFESELL